LQALERFREGQAGPRQAVEQYKQETGAKGRGRQHGLFSGGAAGSSRRLADQHLGSGSGGWPRPTACFKAFPAPSPVRSLPPPLSGELDFIDAYAFGMIWDNDSCQKLGELYRGKISQTPVLMFLPPITSVPGERRR